MTFAKETEKDISRVPPETAAAFALEAAAACLENHQLEVTLNRDHVRHLLRVGWQQATKEIVKDDFLLAWVLAASALSQGSGAELPFQHIDRNFEMTRMLDQVMVRLRRRSDLTISKAFVESRWVHTRAAEGWFSSGGQQYLVRLGRTGDPWPADEVTTAIKRFLPLIDDPVVGGEARLQLGYLRHLDGKPDDAMALLRDLETRSKDSWMLYNARFLRGQIDTGRRIYSAAARSFESALELYPTASSARRSLGALRYLDGDRAAASRLFEPQAGTDPWFEFAYGEYRHWPDRLARVRRLLP
jgi:hypothetical protein